MLSCSITVRIRRDSDSWWRQEGTIGLWYYKSEVHTELHEFDSERGHFPTPRGGFKLVRWPDTNLLIDDYSHTGVIFHNLKVQKDVERVFVASGFAKLLISVVARQQPHRIPPPGMSLECSQLCGNTGLLVYY